MNYLIGFLVGLESSLLLLDQRFYWRSMITIFIFLIYALKNFRYSQLRSRISKPLFVTIIGFIVYFYLNYDFYFFPEFYSRWGLTQKIYYLFSTPILLVIFLLILGSKKTNHLKEFIFSFSMTFAFLGFLLNVIDYHGTENENFLAVRFLLLIPIFLVYFKNNFIRVIFFITLFNINLFYFSRTILAASALFILLLTFRKIIFDSKRIFYTLNFFACFVLSVFPVLFLIAFQEDSYFTSIFLSESKGVTGRFLIWAEVLLRVSENEFLLFGHGSNHDTLYYQSDYFLRNLSSHNMLLETLFRLGIVGYLLMISLLFQILNSCYAGKDDYSIQLAWILIICGMFLSCLYEFILFDGSGILNNIVFWFTLATLLVGSSLNRSSQA